MFGKYDFNIPQFLVTFQQPWICWKTLWKKNLRVFSTNLNKLIVDVSTLTKEPPANARLFVVSGVRSGWKSGVYATSAADGQIHRSKRFRATTLGSNRKSSEGIQARFWGLRLSSCSLLSLLGWIRGEYFRRERNLQQKTKGPFGTLFCSTLASYAAEQRCKRASFWSLNPARTRHLFLKSDLGPKAKFAEWIKICAIARYWCRSEVNMTKQFKIHHFHWTFNRLECFNNNCRQNLGSCRSAWFSKPRVSSTFIHTNPRTLSVCQRSKISTNLQKSALFGTTTLFYLLKRWPFVLYVAATVTSKQLLMRIYRHPM